MNRIARNWRVLVGGVAAGSVAVLGFTGASASADPVPPAPPAPAVATATATVTQTVTVAPQAASTAAAPPAATPAVVAAAPSAATPAAVAATTQPAAAPVQAPVPALAPATSGTLAEYLKEKGVVLEPQKAAGFTALNIVLPIPTGWRIIPDPNVPNAFSVIADRQGGDGLYTSNAQLMVSKLIGDFDPREAISHGYIENQKLLAWQSTSASMADFGGFPSSLIEGTYRDTDMTLNTSRRQVIAQSGSDRFLVTLSVTTAANQAVAAAAATDGITKGFKVAAPDATPAVAPVTAAAAPVPPAATPGVPAAVPAAAAMPEVAVTVAPPAPVAAPAPAAVPAQ